MLSSNPINSVFELQFQDLYQQQGLEKINQYFLQFLSDADEDLYQQYCLALNDLNKKNYSALLIKVGAVLEEFLVLFFDIKTANSELQNQHRALANLYIAKRLFVQRRVAKNKSLVVSRESLVIDKFFNCGEIELANQIAVYLQDEDKYGAQLEELEKYCAWALFSEEGKAKHQNGVLFKLPKKIDFENLVELENTSSSERKLGSGLDGQDPASSQRKLGSQPDGQDPSLRWDDGDFNIKKSAEHHLKNRDGFKLTDQGCNLAEALDQANYCIFCHNQGKDSCRSGLKEKDASIANAVDGGAPLGCGVKNIFKKDQFKTELSGCPLDEKISEMNLLKSEGKSIAALAMAIIDNPMIAGTGHRICNDCMKSCIYQKQEPVNIPQVETRTLKDVLELPFGFEIYSLLTRWNPLNLERVLEKAPTGYKVLVAGLGPSGYTLAHHLLNEGHLVVGVDGLKIEPLDPEISGIDLLGNRQKFRPIKDIKEIYEELDERQIGGFGGVAEYGITVRWNKNFLKVIRLLLERRQNFRMFGGFRLGSGLDCYDALSEANFDHVALCLGAGWAKVPEIKNNFLKGVRMASDFLMALQLTGAERKTLPSNLQLRLPILVVGSGLTAIDTACEALAYYPKQVENFAHHYQILCEKIGKDAVEKSWNEEDKLIAKEFLAHHELISQAKSRGENITKLLQKLGGAKIIYRKKLQDSPAYRLNHEEVAKAFEEGIEFIENTTPLEAVDDGFGQIKALKVLIDNKEIEIPARALFLAAGTTPNKAPFYEDKLKFELDGGTFQIIDLLGEKLPAIASPKGDGIGFLCAQNEQGKTVSFFGDLHPSFNGSVVKAMASAKNGYPIITQSLESLEKNGLPRAKSAGNDEIYRTFLEKINNDFAVKVKEVNILSDYFIELVVHAPLLARKTKLGHIFRLHNYHSLAKKVWIAASPKAPRNDEISDSNQNPQHRHCEEQSDVAIQNQQGTILAMEGVAVTTYKVNPQAGTITVMVVNVGGSSSIVKNLQVGEPIIFMGPTGAPTKLFYQPPSFPNGNSIPLNKGIIVLIAGGRGIFPLAGLAAEYKKNNCKVILFCGFHKKEDVVREEELRNSCDELILDFSEDVVLAAVNYFKNKPQKIAEKIDVVLTMGNEEMMHKVSQIYHNELKENLSEAAVGITSLNNPMQCMLKGVCSQCLQRKIDKNGKERFFYACLGQDQKLSEIDFGFLKNRCGQNSLAEKLTNKWLDNL